MILLWGLPKDDPLAAVGKVLSNWNVPYLFLDQRAVLDTEILLNVEAGIKGLLRIGKQSLTLSDVTSVYLRPYESRRLPQVRHAQHTASTAVHASNVDDIMLSWVEITPMLVINRPSVMAANNSKPYQALQIRDCGFAVPDTLVTTDVSAVEKFWHRHKRIIYKSISGVRSIVAELTPGDFTRLSDIAWCPTQFQEYVHGTDYRVHVIGDDIFACEIISDAADYRYASRQGASVRISPFTLPTDCAEKCRRLVARMELHVAGVDLRRTPDDNWYCFEVNPSPGFTYYQESTNQPIDQAIARLLMLGAH